jgi:polysaccharide pyruvyl transferase WcaK-like protein
MNGGAPADVRIVIDPGSHAVLNLGDIAMLQVAVRRLLELWPSAWIDVLTTRPDALARHCPEVHPLPAAGRYGWLADDARGARAALVRVARLGNGGPLAQRRSMRAESAIRGLGAEVRAYLDALASADLFAISGRGGMTDAFPEETLAVADELETAARLGVPAALLGQGVGPLDDPGLRERTARPLPGVGAIAVREARLASRLLGELGVARSRIAVTGDDAIELAFAARPERPAATGLGLSMRDSPASGMGGQLEAVAASIRTVARRLGTHVVAVPISLYPGSEDAATIGRMLGAPPSEIDDPAGAIAAAGGCRAVVSSAYHAALFAAAQGVPVVALVTSPYYEGKMGGLRDAFGAGVTLVRTDQPALRRRLDEAIDFAWNAPADERQRMLAAAERQVAAGTEAYRRLRDLVAAPVATVRA